MAESTVLAGQQILPLIDHLARVGRRAVDSGFTGCLRPRHLIALRLLHERGPMPQHGLGAALSLDPSNVVGLLNELEERGLVERRRDPADRRRHIVSLSAGGEEELARTYSRLGLVEDELFSVLSADERATLHALLERVVGAATVESPGCAGGKACAADPPLPDEPAEPAEPAC
jgi:MarR family transcriptional regulator, lower aerobic nicotinate degradation pathway regulator